MLWAVVVAAAMVVARCSRWLWLVGGHTASSPGVGIESRASVKGAAEGLQEGCKGVAMSLLGLPSVERSRPLHSHASSVLHL